MNSAPVLIIGAGGVGRVVAHKCAQLSDVFPNITLASRTRAKCDQIASELSRPIATAQVDADDPKATADLIRSCGATTVINVALPYQDLSIMEACLEAGAHYIDTANYEPKDEARFSYEYQWPYHQKFVDAGLTALLGSGFDPGVTNVYCAYAAKHLFDEIHFVDILDCNAGDHGLPFATNFNPEINIREITANGRYWEGGAWKETSPLEIHRPFDFPVVGEKEIYLLYHEEMESLSKHLPHLKRIRFWMTFGQSYITHLRVLENVGMTSIEPLKIQGVEIAPLEFLKAVLPDPASLGPLTKGKTVIGNIIEGIKDGEPRKIYIYNICDHEACFAETNAQAISYTTGVPAMIGAKLVHTGVWQKPGVWNMEQFDPDPFADDLNAYGLPWQVEELDPASPPVW
jgi:saccharopine dehydrogenase (NAD+, L-lysine-forming)